MIKVFAWLVCYTLFWVGHFVSRCLPDIFYPWYNNLMYWSCLVNDKYGLTIWGLHLGDRCVVNLDDEGEFRGVIIDKQDGTYLVKPDGDSTVAVWCKDVILEGWWLNNE